MSEAATSLLNQHTPGRARLVYAGLLVGLLLPGLNVLAIGLTYLGGPTSDPMLSSHTRNQRHIFWKSIVYVVIGIVLTYYLIGILVLTAAFAWYILRIFRGLRALRAGQPADNPADWLF